LFAVQDLLREAGHTVVPFAMRYARNEDAPSADYFPRPPVDDEFVYYGDRALGPREQARLARRVVRDREVYGAAARILAEERIDVVYALQIAHYLYPDLLLAARDAGVPAVMRLSDYQMICPAYNCLRDGKPCFLCRHSLVPALVHRCLKKSLPVTATRVLAMTYARTRGVPQSVAMYVTPSEFLAERMRDAGFAAQRLTHLPTPLVLPSDPGPPPDDGPLLYVGGLFEAKGIETAIDAVAGTGRKLVIAGDADTPYGRHLQAHVQLKGISEVEFAGFLEGEHLEQQYAAARAVVVPSIWWENTPHSALEALARRRPVLAAKHGSLPETVTDGDTGILFEPGDADSLRAAIVRLDQPGLADKLGSAGRELIARKHDPQLHLQNLIALLQGVLR